MTTARPVALVTGASSGIGLAAASGLVDAGFEVVGTSRNAADEEHSIEQDQHVFDINVFGVIRMTRAVLPHMRARGAGRVINISSASALPRRCDHFGARFRVV